MSNRLSGISSLAYQGTNAQQPPNVKRYDRAPTVNDAQNVSLGDFWIHEKSRTSNDSDLYVLMGLAGGVADWDLLSSNNGSVTQFTTDDAAVVIPVNGNVNLSGAHGLNTTGSGDTATFAINNAITLGDLTPIAGGSNALSCTTGDINIAAGNLKLPNTASDGNSGEIQFGGSRFISNYGTSNTFVGINSGNTTLTVASATGNNAVGASALSAITTGTGNDCMGVNALLFCTSGSSNAAFGNASQTFLTTGNQNSSLGKFSITKIVNGNGNCAIGYNSGAQLTNGNYNNLIGQSSGFAYTTTESSNIVISNTGVVGDNNTIRIGAYGSSDQEQNKCYIAACYSNYGTQNTFVGELSGNTTTTGGGTNVGVGYNTLHAITTAAGQVAIGNNALSNVTTAGGSTNVAVGPGALSTITTTGANVGVGYMSLAASTGTQNTSVGHASAEFLVSGTDSCFMGFEAGTAYTGSESNNILIGSSQHGTNGESNVIRIGVGSTKTFIAGIRGITTGAADAVAVLIDSNGQLGTVSSSARYKENIEDMASSSDAIMQLRPVTFHYKKDESRSKRYGLIAEEVAEIFPDLAIFNPDGEVETVKYHDMTPMLLNELQKLSKRVQSLEEELMKLKGQS